MSANLSHMSHEGVNPDASSPAIKSI